MCEGVGVCMRVRVCAYVALTKPHQVSFTRDNIGNSDSLVRGNCVEIRRYLNHACESTRKYFVYMQ